MKCDGRTTVDCMREHLEKGIARDQKKVKMSKTK